MPLFKDIVKKILVNAPAQFDPVFSGIFGSFPFLKRIDVRLQNLALAWSDSFTESDWRVVQTEKIRLLLKHAQENVLFWRETFGKIDFDANRFGDLSELQKIPVLSRGSLKKLPLAEVVDATLVANRGVLSHTSGSTGQPLEFYKDRRDLLRRVVNTKQELRYGLGISRLGVPFAVLGLQRHADVAHIKPAFDGTDLENKVTRYFEIYSYLKKNRPVLIANTALLRRMAMLLSGPDKRVVPISLRGIFYRGEPLDDSKRAWFSQFFQCPVFSTYGTSECSLLGIECEQHQLHAAPWMNYVEILDEYDNPVPLGQEGSVVATFLDNFVMPFIRYKIGDRGRIEHMRCLCGRSTPVIHFSGRANAMIKLPSGRAVPLLSITTNLTENFSDRIFQYQFEVTSDRVRFRYVPFLEPTPDDTKVRIREYLLTHFKEEITLEILPVADIPVGGNGKISLIIDRTTGHDLLQ